jgi:IS5 family transposase
MFLRWAGRVAGVRELRNAYNISIRRCEGQNLFRGRDDKKNKMGLKRRSNWKVWAGFTLA